MKHLPAPPLRPPPSAALDIAANAARRSAKAKGDALSALIRVKIAVNWTATAGIADDRIKNVPKVGHDATSYFVVSLAASLSLSWALNPSGHFISAQCDSLRILFPFFSSPSPA